LFADVDNFTEFVGVVEAVIVAGAGLRDVDRGEYAAFGEFAVEAGFGFDEGGGENRKRTAIFDVAGCAEEFA